MDDGGRLREIAEKAKDGEWRLFVPVNERGDDEPFIGNSSATVFLDVVGGMDIARFVEAASPDAVLRLLDVVDAARALVQHRVGWKALEGVSDWRERDPLLAATADALEAVEARP